MRGFFNTLLDVFLTALVIKFNYIFCLFAGFISNDKFRLFLVEGKEIIGLVVALLVLFKVVIDLRKSIKK